LFNVDDVVQVGQVLAIIEIDGDDEVLETSTEETPVDVAPENDEVVQHIEQSISKAKEAVEADVTNIWNWRKKMKDVFMKREGADDEYFFTREQYCQEEKYKLGYGSGFT